MEGDTLSGSAHNHKTEPPKSKSKPIKGQRKLAKQQQQQRRILDKMETGPVSASSTSSSKEIQRDSGEGLPMKKTEIESGKDKDADAALIKEIMSLELKEIASLEMEHKNLLAALTPTFSGWKGIFLPPTWRKPDMASVSVQTDKELAELLDFVLQDMDNLGHRMLSLIHSLKKSNATHSTASICSYKARELCCTTSRLDKVIRKEFPWSPQLELVEEEPGQERKFPMRFLNLFNKYRQFPQQYDNELALLVVAQQEDALEEDSGSKLDDLVKKEEEEQAQLDKSSMEYLNKRMESERIDLAYECRFWENSWGNKDGRCGAFGDTTTLSPMQFTHYTPGVIPSPAAVAASTLQVYSIKIKILKDLKWPLKVYGEVAARDTVDHNRNILFSRSRFEYQELTQEDCSLCLIGPSRAIVAIDPVDFEVELHTVEGVDKDRVLMSLTHRAKDGLPISLSNDCCAAEFRLKLIDKSFQATILGVRVTKGQWPFKYGCRVLCSWSRLAATEVIPSTYSNVVLLDYHGEGMPRGSDSYVHLSRKVVSVESEGTLRVTIEAYGESRPCIAQKGHVDFAIEDCQISTCECWVGDATLEVSVAWSLLVSEKADLFLG